MANAFCDIQISAKSLEVPALDYSPTAGAVVEFHGVVRDLEGAEPIRGIEYEAHPRMAVPQLREVCEQAITSYAIESLTLHHREGFVPAGEPSLFLRVSARHRGPAIAACQWIIDALKERVPIWKHPVPLGAAQLETKTR